MGRANALGTDSTRVDDIGDRLEAYAGGRWRPSNAAWIVTIAIGLTLTRMRMKGRTLRTSGSLPVTLSTLPAFIVPSGASIRSK